MGLMIKSDSSNLTFTFYVNDLITAIKIILEKTFTLWIIVSGHFNNSEKVNFKTVQLNYIRMYCKYHVLIAKN